MFFKFTWQWLITWDNMGWLCYKLSPQWSQTWDAVVIFKLTGHDHNHWMTKIASWVSQDWNNGIYRSRLGDPIWLSIGLKFWPSQDWQWSGCSSWPGNDCNVGCTSWPTTIVNMEWQWLITWGWLLWVVPAMIANMGRSLF